MSDNILQVTNLLSQTSPEDIEELFSQYGNIRDIYKNYDDDDEIVIVEFSNSKDAKNALELNGFKLHGANIEVKYSRNITIDIIPAKEWYGDGDEAHRK